MRSRDRSEVGEISIQGDGRKITNLSNGTVADDDAFDRLHFK